MGDIIRHHSYGVARSLEAVNVRTLSENRRIYTQGWSHYPSSSSSSSCPSSKQRVLKEEKSSCHSFKWWWNNPEMKRRRRISTYKLYSAETNVKRSFKKGLRWLGKKCSMIIRRI